MIDKEMIFQIRTNSEMEVQDPCDETNPTSHDASQAISIKVEEVSGAEDEVDPVPIPFRKIKAEPEEASDAEEEVDPVPIPFPKIKAEPEVRCMSLYVHCKQ
jgi:hypothetical protein